MSTPVPVTERWGKRNLFDRFPESVECVAADGGELYIATASRHISYSGAQYSVMDQAIVEDTAGDEDLAVLLPANARPVSWHLGKENLADFIDNLEHAFVLGGSNRFYLVANVPDQVSGQPVREYTIPSIPDFWSELANAIPAGETADTIGAWQSVDSAVYYENSSAKRLYITNLNEVFVKDYVAGTYGTYEIDALTHPDLPNLTYVTLPGGAVSLPWTDVPSNLMGFIGRLTGVSKPSSSILLVAHTIGGGYEYASPSGEVLFDTIAAVINDATVSPTVRGLTELTSAALFATPRIKRLYLRSGQTVVIYDYLSATWTVKSVAELVHPNLTSKLASLSGVISSGSANSWEEVTTDLGGFLVTVERAMVWKGIFYLLTPKGGGGYEFTSPTAQAFWQSVGATLADAAGFSTVDSAVVIRSNGASKLYVTSGSSVVAFDYSSREWSLSSINDTWGVNTFTSLSGVVQLADESTYLFSGGEFAESMGTSSTLSPKWGQMKSVISLRTERGEAGKVDAAFMDEAQNVYLFIGDYVLRYATADAEAVDADFVDVKTTDYFHIDRSELAEEFSTQLNVDPSSPEPKIEIQSVGTNTAFIQKVNGEEKLHLFVDIAAKITRYVWKTRWVWWGGWNWRNYSSGDSLGRKRRMWWGWWYPERYLETHTENARKSAYVRVSKPDDVWVTDFDYPKVITGAWTNLPGDFNNMITATFEDKDEQGNDVFYVIRNVGEGTAAAYDGLVKYTGRKNFPAEIAEVNYEIVRLTSGTSEVLAQKLFVGGIDSLLSLSTQQEKELPLFAKKDQNSVDILGEDNPASLMTLNDVRENDLIRYRIWNENTENLKYLVQLPVSDGLDFKSINGQYYWELFFHAPFLIAQAFNNGQNFDEARRWFEYIFDPTELYDESKKDFWKFNPFHDDLDDDGAYGLNSGIQYRRYQDDPFDPHAIAQLRQIAYRKCIVMAYIDNLLDHGDLLFTQYTRETINEARMLYVLAYDLLGKKPELLGTRRLSGAKTV